MSGAEEAKLSASKGLFNFFFSNLFGCLTEFEERRNNFLEAFRDVVKALYLRILILYLKSLEMFSDL